MVNDWLPAKILVGFMGAAHKLTQFKYRLTKQKLPFSSPATHRPRPAAIALQLPLLKAAATLDKCFSFISYFVFFSAYQFDNGLSICGNCIRFGPHINLQFNTKGQSSNCAPPTSCRNFRFRFTFFCNWNFPTLLFIVYVNTWVIFQAACRSVRMNETWIKANIDGQIEWLNKRL